MSWFARVHGQIGKLVNDEPSPSAAMKQLLAWCAVNRPHPGWARFDQLGIDSELPRLERWLGEVLRSEPPEETITAFWFGLFTAVHADDVTRSEMYVSGSRRYAGDLDAEDWNCAPEYWPPSRNAGSKVLATIYRQAYGVPDPLGNEAEYPLTLGYAAFVVAHLCRTLGPASLLGGAKRRAAIVGFDDGDMLSVGDITTDGFEPTRRD